MSVYSQLWVLAFCSYCVVINCYLQVHLEDKLCAAGGKSSGITLLDGSDSAAILTQQWNGDLSSNKVRYDCEFKVLSQNDAYRIPRGTYAVITRIKFRKKPNSNECLDYIQFRSESDSPSEPICGDSFKDGLTNNLIRDHQIRDVAIQIHIDNSTQITEPLELRMVMTAHSQCTHKDDLLCDINLPYSCISRHFIHDNVTNCPPPCRDEPFCLQETAETFAKSADSNDNKIRKKETQEEMLVGSRIADDSPSYITVKILEEKLKENTEVLRALMKENEASLLSQIYAKISGKEVDTPADFDIKDEQKHFSKYITEELLASKIQDLFDAKLEELFKARLLVLKDSILRAVQKVAQYNSDLSKLADRVENLKKSTP